MAGRLSSTNDGGSGELDPSTTVVVLRHSVCLFARLLHISHSNYSYMYKEPRMMRRVLVQQEARGVNDGHNGAGSIYNELIISNVYWDIRNPSSTRTDSNRLAPQSSCARVSAVFSPSSTNRLSRLTRSNACLHAFQILTVTDLPQLIDAIMFSAGGEARAREVHSAFLSYYNRDASQTPLLSFKGSFFVDVSDAE